MAEQTVSAMVQNILSRMSSDEVNSIGDTTESQQVAQLLQNKYYDIVARGSLTIDETLFQLTPSDNANNPVQMLLPAGVSRIDWLQYFDTNPLDNTQTDQFGAFSHDLNTNLVSSVAWTTISTYLYPGGIRGGLAEERTQLLNVPGPDALVILSVNEVPT